MKSKEHELVVVFKKEIPEEKTLDIMKSFHVNFRSGMDSSRGKIYFYATGEKFIVHFQSEQEKLDFSKQRHHFKTEIHEIYEADWNIQKD